MPLSKPSILVAAAAQTPQEDSTTSSISEVHKLALTSDTTGNHAADYRGSAQVLRHLGFDPEYRSFLCPGPLRS
jgi:hypothetical protein